MIFWSSAICSPEGGGINSNSASLSQAIVFGLSQLVIGQDIHFCISAQFRAMNFAVASMFSESAL